MQPSNKLQKCLLLISGLPEDIKAYEIYDEMMSKRINILSLGFRSKTLKEEKLFLKTCYYKIEEDIVKPNKHLVTQIPKLLQKVTSRYYGIIKEESILHDIRKEKIKEFGAKYPSDSCLAVVYDIRHNIDSFLLRDISIKRKLLTVSELPEEETNGKFPPFYQKGELNFQGCSWSYECFEAGTILKANNENEKPLFRKYWSLKEIEDAKIPLSYRRIFFNFNSPEDASLASLLTISVLFRVQSQMEMRVSLDFLDVSIYSDNERIYWVIKLVKHPACYFCPLSSHEYHAFHVKKWRRVPNFLVHAMPDNIDKIYLSSKNCVRLSFQKYYYEKFPFFKAYEDRLIKLRRLVRVGWECDSPFDTVKYSKMSLNLCTSNIEASKAPFEIKFLVMVMISRGQIDVYDFPGNFVDKLMKPAKKFSKIIVRRAVELMALNKDYDMKFMSYENFKKEFSNSLNMGEILEKNMFIETMKLNNITPFDSCYNLELQITPSCTYYTCGALELPKIIVSKSSSCIENFVLVKFIDENLKPIKAARGLMGKLFYSKYLEEISIFDRRHQFFCFSPLQIQSRSFWVYNSESLNKAQKTNAYLEFLDSSSFWDLKKDINPQEIEVSEYIKNMTNQPDFSYDILDLKNDRIEIIKISTKEANWRHATTNSAEQYKFLRPTSYDGFVPGELLDKISSKFNYGNIPGLVLHYAGKNFVVIRDSAFSYGRSIRFYKDVFPALKGLQKFEIVEIIRYKPAFLNRHLILLLDSFFKSQITKDSRDYINVEKGILILLSEMSQYMNNKDIDFCKRMAISSKHSQLERVLKLYATFSHEPYFVNLTNSILLKTNIDLHRKMKISIEFGAELFGIVDDLGIIKPGEIYCSIDNPLQKPNYNENNFSCVLVARKPYMDIKDIRYFEINNKTNLKNAYNKLKNCILFSKADRDFVLDGTANFASVKKVNCFLLLWDQYFIIPANLREKSFNNENNLPLTKHKLSLEEEKNIKQSDFQQEKLSNCVTYENKITQTETKTEARTHNLSSNKIKNKIKEHFNSLIKIPRLKDIKLLHLVHADTSDTGIRCETAQELSKWYRQYSVNSLLYEQKAVKCLLPLLESSIYLKAPYYLEKIGSLKVVQTQSLLGLLYKKIILSGSHAGSNLTNSNVELKIDHDLLLKGFQEYLKNGLKVLVMYKYDIQKLCFLFRCSSESDLLLSFSREVNMSCEDDYTPSFKKEFTNLKDCVRDLIDKYSLLFRKTVQNEQEKPNPDATPAIIASAWYACSLYELWEKDENLKVFRLQFSSLLKALDSFKIKQVFGLPWFVAGKILKSIKQDYLSKQSS